jgi:hypothetical protein
MIFRLPNGNLVNVVKSDYINDKLYYERLVELHKPVPKLEKTFYNKYNK